MPRTAEDCGRSTAGDLAFRPFAQGGPPLHLGRERTVEIACSAGLILGSKALTRPAPQDYIDPLGRAAAWRDGASAKPLTVSHGDRASGHALCGHVRCRVGCDGLYVLRPCFRIFAGDVGTTELQGSGLFEK